MAKTTLFASYALFSFSLAWAQPSQPHVTEGDANFYLNGSHTFEIQVAHRTKIEWSEFSIAQGETTRFIQPASNSVVINQITGLHSSHILGTLNANGQVYLINPHGIFIGPDAFIQTAGFMATTLDQLSLDENHIPVHFKGDSQASITHLGQIQTAGGRVTLVAAHVENSGKIEGQDITIASAPEVWIKPDAKSVYLIPQVSIQEIEASPDPMEFVIKQEGVIRATGCVESQGRIYLVSSQSTQVNGTLKAAGGSVDILGDQIVVEEKALIDVSQTEKAGSVRIGGDYQGKNPEVPNASYTTVQKGAMILANGLEDGDGGRVIVWGTKSCDFAGSIEGRGGNLSGNGGFAEVSSPLGLNYHGFVNLLALRGKIGMLHLSPFSLSLLNNSGINSNVITTPCPNASYQPIVGANGIVDVGNLATTLNSCSVTLETPNGGDIDVFEGIAGWTAATTLNLITNGNVNWNWVATTTRLTEAPHGSLNIQATGDINFQVTPGLTGAKLGFHTGTGSITLNAGGTISLDDGQTASSHNLVGLMSETGTTTITAANLQMTSNDPIGVPKGVLIGMCSDMIAAYFGTTINNPIIFNISGDVVLTSNNGWVEIGNRITTDPLTSIAGPITFNNIGGALTLQGSNAGIINIGHQLTNSKGTGPTALAGCDIVFKNIGSQVLLRESNSIIQIGHIINAPTYTVNANVDFQNVGSSFIMQDMSSSGALNSVFIGHTSAIASPNNNSYTLSGDLLVGSVTPIQQGLSITAQNGFAIIGHFGIEQDDTVRGDITVQSIGGTPSVFIQTAVSVLPNVLGFAGIGHMCLGASHGTNTTIVGPEAINILAQNGLELVSRSNQLAYIGYLNPVVQLPVTENINIPALNITIGAGQPLSMSAATGTAFIGAQNPSGSIVCPINIMGNPVLQLTASTPLGVTEIINHRVGAPGTSDINIAAQSISLSAAGGNALISSSQNLNVTASTGSIDLNGSSLMQAQASQVTIAGQNMSLTNGSQMSAVTGNLDLVIDNLFPIFPQIGPSTFTLDATSTLNAMGTLKIYTAVRSHNSVQGLINGLPFTPGTIFVNTPQEQWLTYYPFAGLGTPFTFFYKNGPGSFINPAVNRIAFTFLNATQEFLQDMEQLDDFIVYEEVIDLKSDLRFKQGHEQRKQLIRSRRDFHLKWLEPSTYLGHP